MTSRLEKYSWFVGLLSVVVLVVILMNVSTYSNEAKFAQETPVTHTSDLIHNDLADIIMEGKAPGVIAAIISSDSIIGIASAGVRKAGSDVLITTNDNVHLGSCTKVMTSVMLVFAVSLIRTRVVEC